VTSFTMLVLADLAPGRDFRQRLFYGDADQPSAKADKARPKNGIVLSSTCSAYEEQREVARVVIVNAKVKVDHH
jgi:hypothetical protein